MFHKNSTKMATTLSQGKRPGAYLQVTSGWANAE